ncbi:DUF6241 domain-containing protein [Bacillus sp. OK048]|uniref:DUF6241 domain-containing protein n=1 Tax=Bacillus sp. OK048 TaxID=1882761 RepID=UPI00088F4DCB|nr:DUF6241 domain-containing protein [Bacillus sp. OK048]SDN47454.1 hypothetical protein SAMN05443253_112103 [Bacillus sp. OK048]
MVVHKHKFAIIFLASLVLASGGIIGYKFYQEAKDKAAIESQQKAEREAFQKEGRMAETKVISAEMNPTQENIDAAEEAVYLLPNIEEKQKLLDRIAVVKDEFNRNQKINEEARLAKLKPEINQSKIALGIYQSPSEEVLLEILHNMTHQKVRSEEKWEFVQMTEVNLLAVKEVLQENPAYSQNIDMLEIVNNWLRNNFSNIVADHNVIWEFKDGTVGKAYGILSPKEEEDLVKEQFGAR